jgi:penicillin-binding protein 1C
MNRRRAFAASAAIVAVALSAAWMASAPAMPSFAQVRARWRPSDAQLLDRHGEALYSHRVDLHGRRLEWTPLAGISPAMKREAIASEDRRFLRHHGVDFPALAAALAHDLVGAPIRGASTITMQLASMIDPPLARGGRGHSIVRKLEQIRAALALERYWSKSQILEAYLNLVTYRGELQGIDAASRVLLGKAPHGISGAEAAVLAALIRSPNAPRRAVERRAGVLAAAMAPDAPSRADVTRAADLAFAQPGASYGASDLAPHVAARMLRDGATTAHCTLDADVQRFAAQTLERHVEEVRDRNVDDGAVLVVNNTTGEVWSYVGSAGASADSPWVDAVRAQRQPGSALKPFLYGFAIERRLLTAASLLEDTPLEVPEPRGLYRPMDYDRRFRGLVSMRTALASSLNVPAVRTADLVGVGQLAEHLRDLGLDTVVEPGDYYGAALALGSADVSLWDLVGAYRTLAAGGVYLPLTLARESQHHRDGRRIYSAATAFVISDILSDRASRALTFGLENSLATPYWSAVKTGTSKDMRDNWCVGYTDRFTVGVWVGNVSGAPMRDVTGITGAAPVWLAVMNYLHERFGSGAMRRPAGVIAAAVEFPGSVEIPRREWFVGGTAPGSAPPRLSNRPRILSPAPDTIIALDPDIPAELQRVTIAAAGCSARCRLRLDRADVGSAAQIVIWTPAPGRHGLALINAHGATVDSIDFSVRGGNAIARR